MSSSEAPFVRAPRERSVDLARGVAVLGMFVAHTAPSAGPAGVLMLSEYFPFPLFALLLGGGAELVARRMGVRRHFAESMVRALVLVALGWALTQAGAQVAVVLGPLAVAAALGWLLSVLPSALLTALAVLGFAVTEAWTRGVQSWQVDMIVSGRPEAVDWGGLVLSPYYPLPFVLACAAWGVVVVRVLLPRDHSGGPSAIRLAIGGALLTTVAGVLLALGAMDRIDTSASSWGWATTTASLALATAVCAWCGWLSRVVPNVVTKPLYAVGAMAFTAYSLHILWLAFWVRVLFPGERDDTWVNVVGMSVVAVLLALAWQALPWTGRWWRGPLEGVVGSLTGFVGRLVDGSKTDLESPVSPVRPKAPHPASRG